MKLLQRGNECSNLFEILKPNLTSSIRFYFLTTFKSVLSSPYTCGPLCIITIQTVAIWTVANITLNSFLNSRNSLTLPEKLQLGASNHRSPLDESIPFRSIDPKSLKHSHLKPMFWKIITCSTVLLNICASHQFRNKKYIIILSRYYFEFNFALLFVPASF